MFKNFVKHQSVQALSDKFTLELDAIIKAETAKTEAAQFELSAARFKFNMAQAEMQSAERAKSKLAALFG